MRCLGCGSSKQSWSCLPSGPCIAARSVAALAHWSTRLCATNPRAAEPRPLHAAPCMHQANADVWSQRVRCGVVRIPNLGLKVGEVAGRSGRGERAGNFDSGGHMVLCCMPRVACCTACADGRAVRCHACGMPPNRLHTRDASTISSTCMPKPRRTAFVAHRTLLHSLPHSRAQRRTRAVDRRRN